MKTVDATFAVHGMTCAGCSATVSKIIFALPGVLYAGVDLNAAKATVRFDADKTSPEQIKTAIRSAGFTTDD